MSVTPRAVPKNAARPPNDVTVRQGEVIVWSHRLWRIHRTSGKHPAPWDSFRTFGPLETMRWDPHPEPLGEHPGAGVLYAGTIPEVCLAEVFQVTRTIATGPGAPYLTSWAPKRDLRLLDLKGPWPLRNGASASLHATSRAVCRAWAAGIHALSDSDRVAAPGPIDGFRTSSTMEGRGDMIVLFEAASDAFPPRPSFSRPLSDPMVLATVVLPFASSVDWPVVD